MTEKAVVLERIQELGLLAVIRAEGPDQAVRITDALVAGGVLGIEITFTTPDAVGAVRRLAEKYGKEIVLGMGALTEPAHAAAAAEAEVRFLVSPHTAEEHGKAMEETGLPVMMGALTPSDGVSLENLREWFGAGALAVGAGSALIPKDAVRDGRWDAVTARAEAFQPKLNSLPQLKS